MMKKLCPICKQDFHRQSGEPYAKFERRKYCSPKCRDRRPYVRADGQKPGSKARLKKEYVSSEFSLLCLSRPSRFNGQLTLELTRMAAAELRDVQKSLELARRRGRPVGAFVQAEARLAEVLERSPWRVVV